jgi:lysophospholipase L1-like esterase
LLFYGEMESLSRKYRLPLARVHIHWEQCIGSGTDLGCLVQGDLVHPTEEGYRLMAEAVAALFLPQEPSRIG